MGDMKVIKIATGGIGANAYIAFREGSECAFVVDPGDGCSEILAQLEGNGLEDVTHILLTHGHFDHIGAAAELKRATGAKVCIHLRDLNMLKSSRESLAAMAGYHIQPCDADIVLRGGETIEAAGLNVYALHTPGHSVGSVCYIAEGVMFSGDALFHLSVGRTDLPGGDPITYKDTLDNIICGLNHDYIVYPGHGPGTTLFGEFRRNPFLKRAK